MTRTLICGAVVLLAGCTGNDGGAARHDASPDQRYLLTSEPAGARDVRYVKDKAADGEDVVVAGRIGGSAKPFTRDLAAFTIVGLSVEPEGCDDGCDDPWCCVDRKVLKAATTLVKVVDEQGQTVRVRAKDLLGVKELQTVVVKGKVKKDGDGNVVVLASAVFVRPE